MRVLFSIPDGSGSSRWFVLSAVVTRRINDLQMVDCLREARKVLGKGPKTPLHFADLRHEQRVPYIRRVGNLDIRTDQRCRLQTFDQGTGNVSRQ